MSGAHRTAAAILLALFAASNAGYFLLDPEESRFLPWLALYTIQFALLVAVVRTGGAPLSWVVVVGLASRAALWFTEPVLEADYFRYLWDGHVLAHGINPYLYAPELPVLDAIETNYRFFITHSHFSTIYPPVAQYVFWLAHAVAPDSLVGLKIVLTCFDVATGFIVIRWLSERGHAPVNAALYFLNPLVLKEIANSAHLDAVPVFFATAALYWMSQRDHQRVLAWLLLALSVGSKLYAVALAPLLARSDKKWIRGSLGATALLAALTLPFASAGTQLFAGTAAFGRYWIFNASVFRVIDHAWHTIWPGAPLASRVSVGVLFACVVLWQARRLRSSDRLAEASVVVIGALLMLSPVVDAWYVLWILPMAVITRSVPWLTFSYLVSFSYSWFYSEALAMYFMLAEYAILYALLVLLSWRHRSIFDG